MNGAVRCSTCGLLRRPVGPGPYLIKACPRCDRVDLMPSVTKKRAA